MSDLLNTILPPGIFAAGWRARLRPASFRGVAFRVVEGSGEDGRNLAVHVFPLRERHHVEDMGRALPRMRVVGYVIGPDYPAERDALLAALAGSSEAGTLVHPTFGERRCRCEAVRYTESMKEGGFCAFDIVFVEDPPETTADAAPDRFVLALRQVSQVLRLARQGYALYAAANGDLLGFARDTLISWATTTAQDLAGAWLGLPALDLAGTARSIQALGDTAASDPDTFAAEITAPAESLAAEAVPVASVAVTGAGAAQVATASRSAVLEPGRYAALLLARLAAPIPAEAAPARAAALEREAAVVAAVDAALRATWPDSASAISMRDALSDALLLVADAAADRGDAELAVAIGALMALARSDLTDRAARLPRVARYDLPGSLPALALAQRLHSGAARADELVALNGARHPAFMPTAGEWLP